MRFYCWLMELLFARYNTLPDEVWIMTVYFSFRYLLSLGRQRARPSDIVNGSELEIYVHVSTVLFFSICSHINHGINM